MIQITSIPLTEILTESLEVHILILQVQRTIERDLEKKKDLTARIDNQEKLLQDLKDALKQMKDEKG